MNRALVVPILCCVGIALVASGCSQGLWGLGKPPDPTSSDPQALSAGGAEMSGADSKSSEKTSLKNPLALARLSERRGQVDQAERLYLDIIKRAPNNAGAHHRLAVLYAKRGKIQQAEEHFTRALALKSNDAELLSDAGYFYYLTSRSPEAEQHLRRAIEIEPGNAKYSTNLALVVGEQGRRDEAATLFRRAGSASQATANLAFVAAQRGEYEQASNLYNRALTEDPSMRPAADAMIELSKYTSRKRSDWPPAVPGEGRPALAAGQSSGTTTEGRAGPAANQLVTITDGRPVPPPQAHPVAPVKEHPAAGRYGETVAANRYPATPEFDSPAEKGPVVAATQNVPSPGPPGSAPAAGVPCAYVDSLPPSADARRQDQARPVPPARMQPAGTHWPSQDSSATHEPASTGRESQEPAAVSHLVPGWLREPLTLTMIAGMMLVGTGAVGLLRRRLRGHTAAARPDGPRDKHRPRRRLGLRRDRFVRVRTVRG
jgi:Tfp pilus assembly protein PilF